MSRAFPPTTDKRMSGGNNASKNKGLVAKLLSSSHFADNPKANTRSGIDSAPFSPTAAVRAYFQREHCLLAQALG